MKTYSLELAFMDDCKSELPHPPIAVIHLKNYGIRDGTPVITSECVSLGELEYHVDRLKDELETIRKRARAKFAAEDKRH